MFLAKFLLLQWDVKKLCFEYDTEPYYQALDIKVKVFFFFFFKSGNIKVGIF